MWGQVAGFVQASGTELERYMPTTSSEAGQTEQGLCGLPHCNTRVGLHRKGCVGGPSVTDAHTLQAPTRHSAKDVSHSLT